ncbi:MAG: hypothetical protein KF789_08120 [Bdellovibrionaceae bacterium]|nr:hypothetical protein [Pseudobdellovibrionaceae bacterium]
MRVLLALLIGVCFALPVQARDICKCKGDTGYGGPCYDGPGGPKYDGPGGPCYAGPGGACDTTYGGNASSCPEICD